MNEITTIRWSARSRPDYGGSSAAVLLRSGEPLVSVYIGGYGRDASRIYFDGYMPADLMRHQPSQLLDQAREISVSGSRPYAAIAREVQRRLLPRHEQLLAATRAAKADYDSQLARNTALVELAAATARTEARYNGDATSAVLSFGRYGAPVSGRASVRLDSDADVDVRLQVTRTHLVALARLLATLRGPAGAA